MAEIDKRSGIPKEEVGCSQPMKGCAIVRKWGYTRAFSFEYTESNVTACLRKAGCQEIYMDDPSRNLEDRRGFYDMLGILKPGDWVVVTELGRLGRDAREVMAFLTAIRKAGALLYVLNLSVWGETRQERELLLLNDAVLDICQYLVRMKNAWVSRRQRKGIETARKEGKYKGARKMFAPDDPRLLKAIHLYETRRDSGRTVNDIEQMTGINRRTLYRYLKERSIKR